ncbi:MAG: RimK family alpha-L-glutamate ligase [Vulcanisaeta sp.]|jgi:ribosomal protein S6--L-glutamate ligase|uniref:ATP-grasp domain-containing protein n=1 Tax=Vulcanisaeta sp. EB80 TaxID=1650660 RepID=UPI00074ABFE6|nr:RimK family alpha-L-glutamate ligase [Vulcanisaeta sp. EB80]KUO87293.1 MAG: RimK family alpha-L-glutamate ligase [Vulcanisaeta sp. MG_3]PLC68469.1 RimK family alpha-L-glutamate ligase [Vulcanisaeta sp. EB80]
MPKSVVVIGDSPIPDRPSRDLVIYARDAGLNATYMPISRISVKVDKEGSFTVIRDKPFKVDGVFLRSLGVLIDVETFFRRAITIRMLEGGGTIVINPLDGLLKTRNKLETTVILKNRGLPVPDTVGTEDILYAYDVAKSMKEVVIKPLQGSRGYGAVKVDDADVAFQIMRTLLTFKKPIYLQRYIEKPNRDIRVMVIDGEVFGCMVRVAPNGQWKTNVAQGAVGKPCVNIDRAVMELAIKSVESLGLIYGGVDIGEGKDGYVIFEVNGSPDWAELTAVTGRNPAKALVASMIKRLKS